MFKDLKPGFQVSILDKSQKLPIYYLGNVVSISAPRFEQGQPTPGQFQPMYTDRVVDLTIEHDGHTNTYVVYETGNVASIASLTVACSTEPIINEIRAMHKNSSDIVASIDRHKEIVAKCEDILQELNPAFGDAKIQNERIDNIEKSIAGLANSLDRIQALLQAPTNKKKNE